MGQDLGGATTATISVADQQVGTTDLAGISGRLRLRVLEDLGDGSFTETIGGRLCVHG